MTASREESISTSLQQAQQFLALQQPGEAAEIYEAILYQFPAQVEALLGMADISLRMGQSEEADLFAQKALVLEPENPTARLFQVLSLEQHKGTVSALEALAALVQDHPNFVEAALEAARMFDAVGELAMAAQQSERAIAFKPEDPRGHFLRARTYRKLGGYRDALESFDAALQLAPQELDIYLEQADLLCELGEFDTAIVLLDEARRCCGPERVELLAQQVEAQALKGNWSRVAALSEKIAQALPTAPLPLCHLAVARLLEGNIEEAEAALLQARSIAPDFWEPYDLLAQLYTACNLYEKAEEALRSCVALAPQQWIPHNQLGWILLAKPESSAHHEAIALLQTAHQLAPTEPAPLLNLVLALCKLERREEAQQTYRQLTSLPHLPDDIAEQVHSLRELFGDSAL